MLMEELYCGILYWIYVWYFPNHWLTCLLLYSNITDETVFAGKEIECLRDHHYYYYDLYYYYNYHYIGQWRLWERALYIKIGSSVLLWWLFSYTQQCWYQAFAWGLNYTLNWMSWRWLSYLGIQIDTRKYFDTWLYICFVMMLDADT